MFGIAYAMAQPAGNGQPQGSGIGLIVMISYSYFLNNFQYPPNFESFVSSNGRGLLFQTLIVFFLPITFLIMFSTFELIFYTFSQEVVEF